MADGLNTTVRLRIFPEARKELLTGRNGPVGVFTRLKAQEIVIAAKQEVGTKYAGHHSNRPRLASTIKARAISPSPSYEVVAEHPFALAHHQGTPQHIIPKKANKLNKKGVEVVYLFREGWFGPVRRPVTHPGFVGNPFLIKAARIVGLRVDTRGRRRTSFSNQETFGGVFRF